MICCCLDNCAKIVFIITRGNICSRKDNYKEYDTGGMKINVCDTVMKVDYLINMPVLKGHCQTNMTCALKNMKGCLFGLLRKSDTCHGKIEEARKSEQDKVKAIYRSAL